LGAGNVTAGESDAIDIGSNLSSSSEGDCDGEEGNDIISSMPTSRTCRGTVVIKSSIKENKIAGPVEVSKVCFQLQFVMIICIDEID